MEKTAVKPTPLLYPLPAVMVSCGDHPAEYNIITISWTGTVCSAPPMCYISIRPERHSYKIIKRTGEFVINLTTAGLVYATDWCGMKSGKDHDKFREMNLTPIRGQVVKAPLISESPVNIECIVREIIPLGSHHLFLAEVVAINADPDLIHPETGNVDLSKIALMSYAQGFYYPAGQKSGKYGFSVKS
jgi:flavin reductase (DIM6/NTAB) family NADH-FMN oxidoreductase RutF